MYFKLILKMTDDIWLVQDKVGISYWCLSSQTTSNYIELLSNIGFGLQELVDGVGFAMLEHELEWIKEVNNEPV